MRLILLAYTTLMLGFSIASLAMMPRALRDLGHERRLVEREIPGANFERMLEAGYRLNMFLVLVELLYYLLLLRFAGDSAFLFYGAFAFGLIHIAYLVAGRLEKQRLAAEHRWAPGARLLIWATALATVLEIAFLGSALYLIASL